MILSLSLDGSFSIIFLFLSLEIKFKSILIAVGRKQLGEEFGELFFSLGEIEQLANVILNLANIQNNFANQ